ncbi:hypothetical protein CVT25_013210 [Psilocybe cyanescens]|uniref:Uncharacterized protein n=1 Tax=Psilocybe cyanescens TaxID=93625 RepID=A0A409XLH7_PSICY|nr:hypothetical protein CVT25_013210 [Psilocybe cyanescens]
MYPDEGMDENPDLGVKKMTTTMRKALPTKMRRMKELTNTMGALGLKHQVQFHDWWMAQRSPARGCRIPAACKSMYGEGKEGELDGVERWQRGRSQERKANSTCFDVRIQGPASVANTSKVVGRARDETDNDC